MSDSLRDALEKLVEDWRSLPHDPDSTATTVLRHCGAQMASVLAAHPAEPAGISDDAVEAAKEAVIAAAEGKKRFEEDTWVEGFAGDFARAALEAAQPFMGGAS